MMKGPKRIQIYLQITVFLLLVVVLGAITAFRYADYKINEREGEYNNDIAAFEESEQVEAEIATTFFGKQQMLELNGEVRNELGQYMMNNIYKLNNGHLTEIVARQSDETLSMLADYVSYVKRFLDGQGIPMICIITPFSIGKYDPQLPPGVEDFCNDNADRFTAYVRERGVDVLDLRDTMHEDGIDHYDMFYRTDHHWNTNCGFYCYQKLEPWLASHLDCEMDPRISDLNNYEIRTWPEWHMGSYAQMTSLDFAGGADDFSVFVPKFDTMIHEAGIDVPGRLEEAFYHFDALDVKDYTSRLTYDNVLGGGDLYGKTCFNHLANNEIDVLLISNSFYRALYPYLLMQFRSVRYMHTALVPDITPEIMSQYDVVIMLYEPRLLWENGPFNYRYFE